MTTVGTRPDERPPPTPRGGVPLVYVVVGVLAVLLLVAVIVVVTTRLADRDSAGPAVPAHTVTAGRDGRDRASLDLVGGVGVVTIHSGDIQDDLYRISTPDGAGQVPRVSDHDGALAVSLASTGSGGGAGDLDIVLSPDVTWQIRVAGGASLARIDLRGTGVAAVDLTSGVSTVELWLPRPHGTATVRESGGASEFVVHAPAGVPVRVAIDGGAGSVVLDGVTHSGIGGATMFTPEGWDRAADRYDVVATAGVSQLRLDRD